jgi:uncharacterized protein (DUF427 family)
MFPEKQAGESHEYLVNAGKADVPVVIGIDIDEEKLRSECVMARAIWNGVVIAESDNTVIVEGNHYFPIDTVREGILRPSDTHTTCPWKGEASYYTLEVEGQTNRDAAWYYPEPKPAAKEITGRVAFWRGVKVEA